MPRPELVRHIPGARPFTTFVAQKWSGSMRVMTRAPGRRKSIKTQRAALKAAGCDVIRAEKASGTRRDGRTELQDLQDIVHELKERRVTLRATEQPINTGTAA